MIDLRVLSFAEAKQPEYKEKKGEGYIQFGDKNDYPTYLVDLFNKSAKHNAIVKSKVHYITGNGWKGNPEAQGFIDNINRMESLNELTRKVSLDTELFGGYYLQIIWSVTGQVAEVWHLDYTKVRTNKDNTQYWYKEDWNDRNEKMFVYPAFNPNQIATIQIMYVKEYRPATPIYALPTYFGALNYIESDIEISKHVLGNAQTGFSASKLITLPNGEPTDDEKRNIENRFTKRFSGSDGKKFILAFVNDAQRKPIIDDLGASDITKEDFKNVDSLIQTNIFSGHQITTPAIFGIAEAGKLGSRSEMRDGYEIFKNTYVNAKQMALESTFNMLAKLRGIQNPELNILPTEPIGIEFTENILKDIAPKEWLLEKAGIDMSKYPTATTGQVSTPLSVNEHIKGLKGREWQNMQRIIREYSKGKINKQQAYAMLKTGYALSDEEITTWLGEDEVETFNEVFSVFSEFGENKQGYNIWQSRTRFNDDADYQMFADVSQLESNILDQISKQKDITPEVLAEVLNQDIPTIKNALKNLEDNGYIKSKSIKQGKGIDSNIIIERQLVKPLAKSVGDLKPETTQIMVRYSYEWKAGFSDSDISTSRPFCVALLEADRLYSRADIETISARLGYSVWDRRGGWYTQPNGNHSPSCRHEWKTNIVTKKL